MYRGCSTAQLDLLKVDKQHLIQPCIWYYSGDKNMFDQITCSQKLGNTMVSFDNFWFASAFRGSYDLSTTFSDLELRLMNQFHWIEYAKKSLFKDKI